MTFCKVGKPDGALRSNQDMELAIKAVEIA